MTVVLLGAGGTLASDLVAGAPAGIQVRAYSVDELDITDGARVEQMLSGERPRWVINAAAYTNVDHAETDGAAAFAVNTDAVGVLGTLCGRFGARVVHFSTDYVFDGRATRPYRESDPPGPCNVYGESKLAGEKHLLESGADVLLVRTSWLFGLSGKSFPRTMWQRALAMQPTRVVADQQGCPTYAPDLAAAVWNLIGQERTGTFHVASPSATTRLEVTKRVFSAAGAGHLVSACASTEYPSAAARPGYSALDSSEVERIAGIRLPPWQEGLDRFLAVLAAEHVRTARA